MVLLVLLIIKPLDFLLFLNRFRLLVDHLIFFLFYLVPSLYINKRFYFMIYPSSWIFLTCLSAVISLSMVTFAIIPHGLYKFSLCVFYSLDGFLHSFVDCLCSSGDAYGCLLRGFTSPRSLHSLVTSRAYPCDFIPWDLSSCMVFTSRVFPQGFLVTVLSSLCHGSTFTIVSLSRVYPHILPLHYSAWGLLRSPLHRLSFSDWFTVTSFKTLLWLVCKSSS